MPRPKALPRDYIAMFFERTRRFTSIFATLWVCTLIAGFLFATHALGNGLRVSGATVTNAVSSVTVFCPFCSAVRATFADQFRTNHIVVIAKLTKQPKPIDDLDLELPKAELEIVKVEKGDEFVRAGMKFEALLVGTYQLDQEFVVFGVDPPVVVWSTPMSVNERIVEYLEAIQKLPEDELKRLEYFQTFLEDEEPVLAADAYDEFAQASYEALKQLKSKMDRKQLLTWIQDPDVRVNHRRLYLTMLGVCGQSEDAEVLKGIISSGDTHLQAGLDALVASYLMLSGEQGLEFVEKKLIEDPDIDDLPLLSVRSALSFHSTEASVIPKERILQTLRMYLERPKVADAVIPDLARLEDWSVIDRLIVLFKNADESSKWVRVPVIQYLQVCPKDEAKTALEELRKIDPEAVKRASFLSDFNFDTPADSDDDSEGDDLEDDDHSNIREDGSDGGELQPVVARKVFIPSENIDESDTNAGELFSSVAAGSSTNAASSAGGLTETETVGPVGLPGEATLTSNNAPAAKVSSTVASPPTGPQSDIESADGGTALVAEARQNGASGFAVITIPMIASLAVFVLIWSVISGWFERLIF